MLDEIESKSGPLTDKGSATRRFKVKGWPTRHIQRRASLSGLNTKLTQMMVQMLIHQRRPFQRSQRPEKKVRMFCTYARAACCKAAYRFAQPLPLGREFPFIRHHTAFLC
jgi:hypothetical protein